MVEANLRRARVRYPDRIIGDRHTLNGLRTIVGDFYGVLWKEKSEQRSD